MKKVYDLEKNIIEAAKVSSVKFEGNEERKRTFALSLAALSFAKILKCENYDVSTKFSLFKLPSFEQNLEIADIYVENARLDVRVVFEGEKFYIPKSHKKYNAQPDFYIVLKIDSALTKIEPMGYIAPYDLAGEETAGDYYVCDTGILSPFKGFKKALKSINPAIHSFSSNDHQKISELCAAFCDNEISDSEKIYFIKHVIKCESCREKISEFNEFEMIINHVKNYPEVLDDCTLNVLSGMMLAQSQKEVIAEVEEVEEEENNILESAISSSMFEIVKDIAITDAVVETADSLLDFVQSEEGSIDDLSLFDDSADVEAAEEVAVVEEIEEEITLEITETETEAEIEIETEEISSEIESGDLSDLVDFPQAEAVLTEEICEEVGEEPGEDVSSDFGDLMAMETPEEPVAEEVEEEPSVSVEVEHLEAESIEEDHFELHESDGLELDDLDMLDSESEMELDDDSHMISEHVEPEVETEPAVEEVVEETVHAEETIEALAVEEDSEKIELNELNDLNDLNDYEEETPVIEAEMEPEIEPEPVFEEVADEVVELEHSNEQEPADQATPAYTGIELIDEDEVLAEPHVEEEVPAYSGIDMIDEEIPSSQEPEMAKESAAPEINPEIQNLLDDELMQLLAGDDSSEAPMPQEDAIVGMDEEDSIGALYENTPDTGNIEEGEPSLDLTKEPISESTARMTKKIVMAVILLFLVAAGGVTAFYLKFNKANDGAMLPDLNEPAQNGSPLDVAANAPAGNTTPAPPMAQDINKSMTNVFSEQPAAVTITKISWEVSQKLAGDPTFKNYLQVAGKNLQLNLQNDLSYATDFNYNNKVKVSFEIGKDNTIKRIQATESSGSEQIDNVVLQSIKETLKYINVPDIKTYDGNYNLSVVINF